MAAAAPPPASWTWADQLSSWRFWALLIAYVLVDVFSGAARGSVLLDLRISSGLSLAELGNTRQVGAVSALLCLPLAWLAIKWKPLLAMVLLAALTFCGLLVVMQEGLPLWGMSIGWALHGLAGGALVFILPAVIAGGRGGAEAYLIPFGIVATLGFAGGTLSNGLAGFSYDLWEMRSVPYLAAAAVLVSAALLLTLPAQMFAGPPPERGYALTPRSRPPLQVALLFLVPFYGLYWLYRVHGEVAAVAPSRALMSPRGALLGGIFIPFLWLFAVASLAEVLQRKYQENGLPAPPSVLGTSLWALFLPPVAAALLQSRLNRLVPVPQPAQ